MFILLNRLFIMNRFMTLMDLLVVKIHDLLNLIKFDNMLMKMVLKLIAFNELNLGDFRLVCTI